MDDIKTKIMDEVSLKLAEMNELNNVENLVKTNINEFQYNEKIYRVRLPNNLEKDEANKHRMKKYVAMLSDSAYLFRAQWIELFKAKGIDINKLEQTAKESYMHERELQKRLAVTQDPADIKTLKDAIINERATQSEMFIQKEEHLQYCIEKQLEDAVKFYLIYLVLETKNGEQWERVFKSYAEFDTTNEDVLLAKAAQTLAVFVYNGKL